MDTYRTAPEPKDPLDIDPSRVAKQRWQQHLIIHVVIAVCTLGIWLPAVLVLLFLFGRYQRFGSEYRAQLGGGLLTAGTPTEQWTIPLDSISTVSVSGGVLNVNASAGARVQQAHQVYGLRDPAAASRAILAAREEHVRSLGRATQGA